MFKLLGCLAIAFFLIFLPVNADIFESFEAGLSRVASHAARATVKINYHTLQFSGTLISSQGHILTLKGPLHRNAEGLKIETSDGGQFEGKVIKTWPFKGFALLKIKAHHLPFISLGKSQHVQLADQVISLGNAFNSAKGRRTFPGAHYGIISGRRHFGSQEFYFEDEVFLTDARINPGSEGGPLIDANGDLIAINGLPVVASETNSHLSLALPIDVIGSGLREIVQQNKNKKVERVLTIDSQSLGTGGVLVKTLTDVTRRCGFRPNDLVIAVADEKVNGPLNFSQKLMKRSLGRLVPVTIYRNGSFLTRYLPPTQNFPVEASFLSQAYRQAASRAASCTVKIHVERSKTEFNLGVGLLEPRDLFRLGTGPFTGVVYRRDGYLVTSSFNLAGDVQKVVVELNDGRRFPAQILGKDLGRNITLLHIPVKNLPEPQRMDPQQVVVGTPILSLGTTYAANGLPTLDRGVISALNRSAGKAVQIDANLNPGNFGGPTIDLEGRVLGVNIPQANIDSFAGSTEGGQYSGSGIGFVVPFWDIDLLFADLKKGRDLEPAFLGIQFRNDPEIMGAQVSQIIKEVGFPKKNISPNQLLKVKTVEEFRQLHRIEPTGAFKAGLRPGDVIKTLNGRPIPSWNVLLNTIGRLNAGDQATFEVERMEQLITIKATLGPRGRMMP